MADRGSRKIVRLLPGKYGRLLRAPSRSYNRNFRRRERNRTEGYRWLPLETTYRNVCRNSYNRHLWTFQPLPEPCIRRFQPDGEKSRTRSLGYVFNHSTRCATTLRLIRDSNQRRRDIGSLLTGDNNCGVLIGPLWPELNWIADAKSKSHIFTGLSWFRYTHKMFSGFKSRWAIPVIRNDTKKLH